MLHYRLLPIIKSIGYSLSFFMYNCLSLACSYLFIILFMSSLFKVVKLCIIDPVISHACTCFPSIDSISTEYIGNDCYFMPFTVTICLTSWHNGDSLNFLVALLDIKFLPEQVSRYVQSISPCILTGMMAGNDSSASKGVCPVRTASSSWTLSQRMVWCLPWYFRQLLLLQSFPLWPATPQFKHSLFATEKALRFSRVSWILQKSGQWFPSQNMHFFLFWLSISSLSIPLSFPLEIVAFRCIFYFFPS